MSRAETPMREVQQRLKEVLDRVERGESILVTRRRRIVAQLVPAVLAGPAAPWPDLEARLRAVFGDRVISPAPSAMLLRERGER